MDKYTPNAIAAEPANAAATPSPSKRAVGDNTSSPMPVTPATAQAHAAFGGICPPTSQVSSSTISVCVDVKIAASPPVSRYAATNSIA